MSSTRSIPRRRAGGRWCRPLIHRQRPDDRIKLRFVPMVAGRPVYVKQSFGGGSEAEVVDDRGDDVVGGGGAAHVAGEHAGAGGGVDGLLQAGGARREGAGGAP